MVAQVAEVVAYFGMVNAWQSVLKELTRTIFFAYLVHRDAVSVPQKITAQNAILPSIELMIGVLKSVLQVLLRMMF